MRIKRRDGSFAEVDDDYILRDGESYTVGLVMMDSTRRTTMIHDGSGRPAGQRPGFLVRDNAADDQAVEAAYRQYADEISQRWRRPIVGNAHNLPGSNQTQPQSFATAEAARAAAYAEYNRTIQERWRK